MRVNMLQIEDHGLQKVVRQVLWDSSYQELRDVVVHVFEGGVRLRGSIRSWHLKQVAQSLIKRIPGVKHVENNMSVFDVVPYGTSSLDG